jgi:RNA polymerase sigma factor (sigma-70 family)
LDLSELIKQCLRNNPDAQRMLFEKFATPMIRLCLRYLKDQDTAQDAMMNGFMKVFEKLKRFQPQHDHSLEMWIRKIMINECLMMLRKDRSSLFMDVSDVALSLEEIAPENQSAEEIMQLVNTLPNGYRTVFNLHVVDGYSHKEIADMLDISESASRSQLTHARTKLKELLIKHGWND